MDKNVAYLIGAFVAIIIGIALLTTVATQIQDATTLTDVSNETIDITLARNGSGAIQSLNETWVFTLASGYGTGTDWRKGDADCAIAEFVLNNHTGDAFTITTDYLLNTSDGTFTFEDNDDTNITDSNTTYASYKACGASYLSEGWTRSILNLVTGLFAIALLVIGVGLFYKVAKDEGLLNV